MPSQAFDSFLRAEAEALLLRETATEPRLRPISSATKSKYLHAALTAHVAAWDNYVRSVVREYYREISDPLDLRLSHAQGISFQFVEEKLKKLNTPNWDNARNAIVLCTGYDPFGDWRWRAAGLSSNDVREFLNEVFRARHSFAHGFAMPQLNWLARTPGNHNLNVESMKKVEKLLRHLALQTDRGLSLHAATIYGSAPIW